MQVQEDAGSSLEAVRAESQEASAEPVWREALHELIESRERDLEHPSRTCISAILVILHTCIFRDFSHFAHLYFTRF